jgi:O-antigen/teichoic acid export membrane protein
MSRVKTNFFANLAGSGWTALIGLACTPLYIRFMGMEAYGLIGFYFMLQGVIQILDLGLSPTMNREMARYSVLPGKAGEARDFVRTLEVGYWAVGIVIGGAIYFAAPHIATHWIKAGDIPVSEVRRAVAIMGVLAALQWPLSLYQGGLLGLQRQVLLNGISIATATLGGGGALLALWLVSPTISVFFAWQIVIALLQTTVTTIALWRCLPASVNPPHFESGLLRGTWRFAAGMGGITLTALILTQLDKVILSKLLDLKTFGYYVLAGVVANGISTVLVTPMFNTVFPRFSALVAAKDEKRLTEMYHGSTQIMAVLILPVAAVLAFFSQEVMMLWTQNAEVTRNTAPIVSILVAGTALNGMMNLPYALQLAHGWTRLAFTITTAYIFALGPAIVFLTIHYGAIGAASSWAALNVIHVAVMIPLTHRRLLTGESWRWYIEDFGLPLLGTLVVCTVGRTVLAGPMGPPQMAIGLIMLLLATIVCSALTVPAGRRFLIYWRNTTNTGPLS